MKGLWTYTLHTWGCKTRWVKLIFCAKTKIIMVKLLDTKHG